MGVAAKIAAVMQEVGSLTKDKRLQGGGNYEYLSEEKVTTELHAACAKVGLVVFPTTMAILEDREDTTNQGNIKHNVRIQATYRLMDADDDASFVDVMALGEGSDTGDKVINKCMTAAFKYMLRQSFMISTGDDPDKEPSHEATQTRKAQPPTRAAAPEGNGEKPKAGPGPISDKQKGLIHEKAAIIWGKTAEALELYKIWLKQETGKESSRDLTKQEASEVIDKLFSLEKERQAA